MILKLYLCLNVYKCVFFFVHQEQNEKRPHVLKQRGIHLLGLKQEMICCFFVRFSIFTRNNLPLLTS